MFAARIHQEQRRSGVQFEYYRHGLFFDESSAHVQTRIALRPVPAHNIVTAYDVARNPALKAQRDAGLEAKDFNMMGEPNVNIKRVAAQRDPNDIAQALADFKAFQTRWGHQIKFVKTLGIGGQGIAALWEWRYRGRIGRSVIKTALPDTANPNNTARQDALTREKDNTQMLARAKHIVQRFLIQDFINWTLGVPMDNDPATLITELAKRGDLDSLLCKVGRYMFREERNIARRGRGRARRIGNQTLNPYVVEDEKERIPVVVIWQIFECLVTAAISMAFPPRKQAPPTQVAQYPEMGGLLVEEIPDEGAHVNYYDLVHFDIDPQNVLMFDTDGEHRGMPVFKVADLGLAYTPSDTRNTGPGAGPPFAPIERLTMWQSRNIGKDGFHLPEQFTSDWDEVRAFQDPFSQDMNAVPPAPISTLGDLNSVAANYGAWSNVWQIGMVMWCCITLRYPLLPPMAMQEPAIQNTWTYGDEIMGNTYVAFYGQEMCELVAACLAVKPIDRPSLEDLRDNLNNLRPPAVSEEDREWLTRFLREPSRPSAKSVDKAFG